MRLFHSFALAAALVLAACVGRAAPPPLFVRLGGMDRIAVIVDAFLQIVQADERINARFINTDMKHLRQMAIDQVCVDTGGGPVVGCKYTGANMIEAHAGMHLSDAEFDAYVEDTAKALDVAKVPEQEKQEILAGLAAQRADVVNR